jgi:hypothetical protein
MVIVSPKGNIGEDLFIEVYDKLDMEQIPGNLLQEMLWI